MGKHTPELNAQIYALVAKKNNLPPLFVIPREVKPPKVVNVEPSRHIQQQKTITSETSFAELTELFKILSYQNNYERIRVNFEYSGSSGTWTHVNNDVDDEYDENTDEGWSFEPAKTTVQGITVSYLIPNENYANEYAAFVTREKEARHQLDAHEKRQDLIKHFKNSNAQLIRQATSLYREDWINAGREIASKE